jgi:geranylgeranyl pyrophosphate synthase/predicted secreted hydrolase
MKQTVWRKTSDFAALHAALRTELGAAFDVEFPRLSSWVRSLTCSADDNAELARSLLHDYFGAVLASGAARFSRALRTFVREADRPDWPDAVGPIDLAAHDLPHDSSATEWW